MRCLVEREDAALLGRRGRAANGHPVGPLGVLRLRKRREERLLLVAEHTCAMWTRGEWLGYVRGYVSRSQYV